MAFGLKWEHSGVSTPTVHLEFTTRALSFLTPYSSMGVLARDHPEGASNATSNCKFRPRTARPATAPESDALGTAVRSLQGVFRGRPRGLPDLRMQRQDCHWQTCSERCGGVKQMVSQRGSARFNPSRTDAWPSCLDWRAARWLPRKTDAFIQPVYSGRKGQTVVRTRSRGRCPFSLRHLRYRV